MPNVSVAELRGALLELGITSFTVRMTHGPSGSYLVAQIPLRDHPADYGAWLRTEVGRSSAAEMARAGFARASLRGAAADPPPGEDGRPNAPLLEDSGRSNATLRALLEDPVLASERSNAALMAQLAALERMVGSLRRQIRAALQDPQQ